MVKAVLGEHFIYPGIFIVYAVFLNDFYVNDAKIK